VEMAGKRVAEMLLSNKFSNQETRIYVCIGKACKMPVNNVDAAIALIRDM